jgi:hypothetical protein
MPELNYPHSVSPGIARGWATKPHWPGMLGWTMRACRVVRFLLLILLIVGAGCATNQPQSSTTAQRGPIEEPAKDTFWWDVFGFFAVPAAEFSPAGRW